jgi:hypothetical protein
MTEPRARLVVVTLLVVSIGATLAAAAGGFDFPPPLRTVLVATALVPLFAIGLTASLRAALTMTVAGTASVVLAGGAVVLPSHESHDLWSYAMDGRIVSQYGASPYLHSPAAYPHDVFLHLVGSGWRHTRSVYGPLFMWITTAITEVTGTNQLATRLAFQVLAAAALLACVWLVARTTRDPLAVLIIGVNPVVALEIVNPGRNDALVGLAVLGGVLLAVRGRAVWAAAVMTLAVLVKAVALLALGGLVVWVWHRLGPRVAARATAAATALLVVPYLLVGGIDALRPLASASDRLSRASIWQVARDDGIEHLLGTEPADPVRRVLPVVGPAALVLIAALALLWVLSRVRDPTPELVVIAALTAFLFGGSYVLGSYVMWVLPVVAWRHRAGISRAVIVWSSALLLAYQAARGMPSSLDDALAWLASFATVAIGIAAIVGLTLAALRRLRTPAAPVPELVA